MMSFIHALSDMIPAREYWPAMMIVVAAGLAIYLIIEWARHEPQQPTPWHWGDDKRRPTSTVVWASHPLCCAFTCLTIFAAVQVLNP